MGRKLVHRYEVVDHGIMHSQYFGGCGTAGTRFDEVATGIGDSAQEAFDDALGMLASSGWDVDHITMPDDLGEETVSGLIDEEVLTMVCQKCEEAEGDCACEEPQLEAEEREEGDGDWDGDERWYHVSIRVREETAEEVAYRTIREQACAALRLPADVEDGILADAMEDSPAFSDTAIYTIRDGINLE